LAGCCECGDEPLGSGATELVTLGKAAAADHSPPLLPVCGLEGMDMYTHAPIHLHAVVFMHMSNFNVCKYNLYLK
jgi:hypothetical protein